MSKKPKSQKIDAELLFIQGARFDYSGIMLQKVTEQQIEGLKPSKPLASDHVYYPYHSFPTLIPITVCLSFSTELYFKSLISLGGEDVPLVHSYEQLFDCLSTAMKAKLKHYYGRACNSLHQFAAHLKSQGIDLEFMSVLKNTSKSFEEWRYYCKGTPSDPPSGFLHKALRELLLHEKPEWHKLLDEMSNPKPIAT